MKLKLLSALAFSLSLMMMSCNSATETKVTDTKASTDTVVAKKTKLNYVKENTKVSWTAYKTTELIGVSGVFTDFEITGVEQTATPLDVVKNASITIPIAAISSKNPERDERIKNFFFGAMADTDSLTGTVKELSEAGEGVLTLTMNGVTGDVPVKIAVDGLQLTFTSTFSLNDWKAQDAVKALNEECGALHAGTDGVSFLSPDVNIVITTTLEEEAL